MVAIDDVADVSFMLLVAFGCQCCGSVVSWSSVVTVV